MVNTFLPFSDFKKCAQVLDKKRLGKQRVEAMQLIKILEYIDSCTFLEQKSEMIIVNKDKRQVIFFNGDTPFSVRSDFSKGKPRFVSWINHPALKMWVGYTNALKEYTNIMIQEWIFRGYNNTMKIYDLPEKIEYPWFIYWDMLQLSHLASLNRKDPSFYSFNVPEEYTKYTYIWPSKLKSEIIENVKNKKCEYLISELAEKI